MKKLILLLCLIVSINTYSQDSTVVKETDVERIIDKYSEKLTNAIGSLADSLKVPAEQVYKIYIVKVKINAISDAILFSVSLVILLIVSIFIYKRIKRIGRKNTGETEIASFIIILILSFIWFVAFINYFPNILQGLLNPDYLVIEELIRLIK